MFIGREKELDFLNKRYIDNNKEFGVIYGRRRIGKSKLIAEFLKDKEGIFYQAKEDSIYGNLRSFSYEISNIINVPKNYVFSSFEEAFDSLIEHANGRRFVIAIDEYPYIVNQNPSFPSIMQSIIDKAPDNIFFLISGSDISMLKKEIENHSSPLYKRRTFEMKIEKLTYSATVNYLSIVSNEDKVKLMSLTSTFPYYLSAFDLNKSIDENIKNLLFNEYGAFFDLPDHILSNSTKTQDVYNSILYAVSKRRRSNKEIADYIHEEEPKVSKYISTLVDCEVLDRRETFMGNKKTIYYEIGDPMLRFWYSYIFDNKEKIKLNGTLIYNNLKEEINKFVSFGFEDISKLFMEELNSKGMLGDVYNPIKTYRVEKSVLNRSIEIDGLTSNNKKLIVMECKYRNGVFTKEMYLHLIESASVFPSKLEREYYLFSKNGFDENVKKLENINVHLFELSDMFDIK